MKTRVPGPLGEVITRHLQLRRSLGFHLRTDEITLRQFDAYAATNFPDARVVTRPMVTGYFENISDRHLVTRHHQLTTLRQFCRFLFQLNPDTYIPERGLLPAAKCDFQPHIYTPAEVTELMMSALRLPPAGSLRPHTYAALIGCFGLLACAAAKRFG